jgi:transcriptional regulator GlxA family with amidase domain
MERQLKVGILVFNEVEVLDFAGPFEVFSISEAVEDKSKLFNAFLVAEKNEALRARNGLQILPSYTFENCPDLDLLVVPGGYGAEQIEIKNARLLKWLREMRAKTKLLASICTGAFLLAEAGVISDQQVTTHWLDIERLRKEYPSLDVIENVKYVDQGNVFTSAGISAGIELSLYLVSRFFDEKTALRTAKRMDYDWAGL